jgi:hypothetical protein
MLFVNWTNSNKLSVCRPIIRLSTLRRSVIVVHFFFAIVTAVYAQSDPPSLSGPVTAIRSSTDFDVEGVRVQTAGNTVFFVASDPAGKSMNSTRSPSPFLGETSDVSGKVDRKALTVKATRIVLHPEFAHEVSGTAIVDAVLPSGDVRADGRELGGIPEALAHPLPLPNEAVELAEPNEIRPGIWIAYKGLQSPSGVVKLDRARLFANAVHPAQIKLRNNAADVEKQVPLFADVAMQARVDRIGMSLIPAFQRALAADDPIRIPFHFCWWTSRTSMERFHY